jgi:predicted nucleotidyltransferase
MNTLFKTVTGSHLYGTNTPTSDIDYAGVFIADKEFYF